MSWANARDLGREWVDKHLPPDLTGRLVQLADYPDEETCRFFHLHWSLPFRRMVMKAAARKIRVLGGKTENKMVAVQDYLTWLSLETETPDQRRAFLDTIECVIN